MYPLQAFIDETAQAGIRTRISVIQKLRRVPTSRDHARKYATIPTVQRTSIASLSGNASVPPMRKLKAPAGASTTDNP